MFTCFVIGRDQLFIACGHDHALVSQVNCHSWCDVNLLISRGKRFRVEVGHIFPRNARAIRAASQAAQQSQRAP